MTSASSCLAFKLKILKIHPTLPINYMFKILFGVQAFFMCNKISKNFNILEDNQKMTQISASTLSNQVAYKNVYSITADSLYN